MTRRYCACQDAGTIRPCCRAGIIGRCVVPGQWEFAPLECDLDASHLLKTKRPARLRGPRRDTRGHRARPGLNYTSGRRCQVCDDPVTNQNTTGFCINCWSNRRVRAKEEARV